MSKVYTTNAMLSPSDILDWTSIKPDKICLQFQISNPIYRLAHEIVADSLPFLGDKNKRDDMEAFVDGVILTMRDAEIKGDLELILWPDRLYASCNLAISLSDGTRIEEDIPGVLKSCDICPIVNEFFERGAPCLTDEWRERWTNRYEGYLARFPEIATKMTAQEQAKSESEEYLNKQIKRETLLWLVFGNEILRNMRNDALRGYKTCRTCGRRFIPSASNQRICTDCSSYQCKGKKIMKCIDCGAEFEVDARNMKKVRCDGCQKEYRKQWDRERKRRVAT